MQFFIDEVPILFPYPQLYPEQLEYMVTMKRGLDNGGHMVLEMPSGTGKTVCLLSLLLAYTQYHDEDRRKILYCTRTVAEMIKTVEELKGLWAFYEKEKKVKTPILGLCLSSRKNLCVEPSVSSLVIGSDIDAACNRKTSGWASASEKCAFYEGTLKSKFTLPKGVYTLDDMRDIGIDQGLCPYFAIRKAISEADIVVHSFSYIVDPKVHNVVKEHTNSRTIVVMDEGHNVDDVCVEAMSMVITKKDIAIARERNVPDLSAAVDHMKATNRERLQEEYDGLVNGLALAELTSARGRMQSQNGGGSGAAHEGGELSSTALVGYDGRPLQLPPNVAEEAMPACLRQSNLFLKLLKTLTDFMHKIMLRITRTHIADPLTFLAKVREECNVDVRHLQFVTRRLSLLFQTLKISDRYKYRQIVRISEMFEILLMHYKDDRHAQPGFVVICEPCDPTNPLVHDPVIRLACVDPSLAIREIFEKYKSVILTSGTLSPLDIYPKILGFKASTTRSFNMTLSRKCIAPVIVTRSSEQADLLEEELTSSFQTRMNPIQQAQVLQAYGNLVLDMAQVVPDGMVVFFTGYQYMSEVLLSWHASGMMKKLAQHKLIFIETQGVQETETALQHYRRACDIGRGAIFMSIARGKISEGIDFDHQYGRAVIMFGVPFLPPTDEPLKQRMHWMEKCLGIREEEFRNFDAMRQASQCIGRVFRNKTDYGMMVMVDRRFSLNDKKNKLPSWVQANLKQNTNLSVDGAVSAARIFFREMAQPWDMQKGLGTTLYDKTILAQMGFMVQGEAPTRAQLRRKLLEAGATLGDGGDECEAISDEMVHALLGAQEAHKMMTEEEEVIAVAPPTVRVDANGQPMKKSRVEKI